MGSITELLLFSASRAELVRTLIQPAIERHQLVILDRFYDSTTAYQGYGRGIDLNIIHTINQIASLGIEPQLTFYLDLLPEDALMRKFSEKSLPLSFGKNETPLDPHGKFRFGILPPRARRLQNPRSTKPSPLR
jgi:dTMP kinase